MPVGDVQERDISTPVPATVVPVKAMWIIKLSNVEFTFSHKVVVATHDSSQGTHEAA
jgi:hypothetical protein